MRAIRPRRLITALCREDSGGVAILFGLALLPLLAIVGAAIDYGVEVRDAALLETAADAAALAAIAPKSPGYEQAVAAQGDITISVDTTPYVSLFAANASNHPELTLQTTNVSLARVGANVTATVTFTANVKTSLMSIFGWKYMQVSKTASASTNLPAYMDFYLLLDNSPSMGIGATQTDISNLEQYTANDTTYLSNVAGQAGYCGFACHDLSQQGQNPVTDTYTIARANNVTLRIDLLTQATQNLMNFVTQVQANNGVSNEFRFAVDSFGATSTAAQNGVTNVVPLSSDLGSVAQQASSVGLMTVDTAGEYNDADTPFDAALNSLANTNTIPLSGDGSSVNSRQEVLFIVTDGVDDENLSGTRTIQPLDLNKCKAIKNNKVQIAILYTVYYQLTNNSYYMTNIDPFNPVPPNANISPTIAGNLQQCASPGLYGEVQVGGNITQAMQNLFSKIVSRSRLTN